jgi:predicted ferric reductase
MTRARLGAVVLAVLVILPLLAGGLYRPPGADTAAALSWLARVTGVLSLTLMLVAGILSIRVPGLDRWFGGLTRLWGIHHVLGWSGFMLVMIHVWLVAGSALNLSLEAAMYNLFPPLVYWPVWAGWAGFAALLVFLAPTFKFFNEPAYRRWKRLHLISALALLLGVIHALALGSGPGAWLLLGTLAMAAYTWRKLLSPLLARHDYRVAAVQTLGPDMVELSLEPEGRPLRHGPGQFVYLTPLDPALADGCGEEHPYTLSSAPSEPRLRVGIKALGDATHALQDVRPGSRMQLEGPYGDFLTRRYTERPALWLGGGIGITPFVSGVRALQGHAVAPPVHLFYLVNEAADACYRRELERLAAEIPGFALTVHQREQEGVLDEAFLAAHCPDFAEREVWICGPPVLTGHLRAILRTHGVPRRRIHSEAFTLL